MKVEVKEVEKEGFKPFKIEITIETVEEAKDLYARFYLTEREVNDASIGCRAENWGGTSVKYNKILSGLLDKIPW